jgi:hypothetical protein
MVTARPHTSAAHGSASPWRSVSKRSGLIYAAVRVGGAVVSGAGEHLGDAEVGDLDPPPPSVTRRFAGLTSRWTTQRAWRCASLDSACAATSATAASGNAPRWLATLSREPPSTSSNRSATSPEA